MSIYTPTYELTKPYWRFTILAHIHPKNGGQDPKLQLGLLCDEEVTVHERSKVVHKKSS